MFNKNKSRLYLGLFLSFVFGVMNIGYVNATTFADRLSEVGLDIVSFSSKNSISRYEVARLLNAANCEDCMQAPDWMRRTYTQNFWDNFRLIDGKDFNDVDYQAGVWNKKSYYYCVAYVGDNGYMAGYPSTSTKCKGNFCGQEAITTSEFYQTVLNIIQPQIRGKYRINWSDVKSWMKGLKKNSMQMRVLNQTNIEAINKADIKSQYAQNDEEFQAWLKYCMYNLSACNFQSFGVIGTGYWPVSELNVLYKEGVITVEDAENTASFPNMKGEEAIRIFSAVYDNYASCSFNVDYDCDGITNGKDNCPYAYNLNQYDLDEDGIGNVCDDDVDGDGRKNPIGIVDDSNHIVISLWDNNLDQTPLGDGELGFSFFINVDAISSSFPTLFRFSPLTDGDIAKIEWNFGDGTKQVVNGSSRVNHTFQDVGTFSVKAVATTRNGSKSFAMTKVFVATPESEKYVLNLSPKVLFKNGSVEYTFTPLYSGNLDTIKWSVNNSTEQTQKVTEQFKTTVKEDGLYIVRAKGYAKGELKAVAMLNMIKSGSQFFANMGLKVGDLWDKTSVTTNLVGVDRKDIDYISIDWGETMTNSTSLSQDFTYQEAGLKTVQQNVVLKNGITLYSVATLTVQNPLLTQSYAINLEGNRLSYNQNENLALGINMYPQSSVLSLFTSYQAGQKRFVYNPNLTQTILDFAYVTAGDKLLTNSVDVNRCVSLLNQGTVHINSVDVCENAKKNNKLSQYKCDQDKDGIPDICDEDIDGDGVKNLIGIILYENKDCSIGVNNVNPEILRKELGICSLDNCPFVVNSSQSDLNNNGIGDLCDSEISSLLGQSLFTVGGTSTLLVNKDQDGDGVLDSMDECVDVPGNSANGCPELYDRDCWIFSTCGNGRVDEGETCFSCPQDVGICCGNGVLDVGETCKTCSADAGDCAECGNGKVENGENCENCPQDLGGICVPWCGNGKYERGETCINCPQDLGDKCKPEPRCGDGNVDKGENCNNCKEDLKDCIPTCGNGKYDRGETCINCPEDLGICPNSCGNGMIETPEQCDNGWSNNGKDGKCSEECISLNPLCGNGKKEGKEECDLGENNGKYVNGTGCTVSCTKFDSNKPDCGDGDYDGWERCDTCAIDLGWACRGKCGDGVLNVNEECDNGVDNGKDGKCTFECKKVTDETKYCGNGKVEKGEECDHGALNGNDLECSNECKNVKKEWKCGNGVVEEVGGEECDMGENNGKQGVNCTKECKYEKKCENGKPDGGETCKTCPEDLGDKCKPEPRCGDETINKGENCRNCEEDLKACIPTCGNGEYNEGETCTNCPQDMGECPNSCGNGKKESPEECDNGENNGIDGKCTKDCVAINQICGNGKREGSEECDLGEKNGKYENEKSCTVGCTYFNPNNPNDGDGEIEEWENCENAAIDFGGACMGRCGDGAVDQSKEECDNGKENGRDGKCTFECKKVVDSTKYCGNGKVEKELGEECDDGAMNGKNAKCSEKCKTESEKSVCGNGKVEKGEECDYGKDLNGKEGINCTIGCKRNEKCGDGEEDEGENCEKCPQDLGDKCKPDGVCGDGYADENENCEGCPEDVGICFGFCGNGKIDVGEECDPNDESMKNWGDYGCSDLCRINRSNEAICNSEYDGKELLELDFSYNLCLKGDVSDFKLENNIWTWLCVGGKMIVQCTAKKTYCGDGVLGEGENCENCPEDGKDSCHPDNPDENEGWHIENYNCNSCPCAYVDFSTDLARGDIIRAKLWDKKASVFYKYSNSVAVESFLDL